MSLLRADLRKLLRRPAIKRMGNFVTYIKGDYELAKKWYGCAGRWHECLLYTSNVYKKNVIGERAADADASWAKPHIGLALVAVQKGDIPAAIKHLEKAISTGTDAADAAKVAIVNREMVRRHWKDQDPIGKVISVNPPLSLVPRGTVPPDYEPTLYTVVGVAADVHYAALNQAPLPVVYVPFAQGSEGTTTSPAMIRARRSSICGRISSMNPPL